MFNSNKTIQLKIDLEKILSTNYKTISDLSFEDGFVFFKPKILFVGNSFVGKSSLFNRIFKESISKVSKIPYNSGLFNEKEWINSIIFIDSPSFNPDKNNKELINKIKNSDVVIQICSIGTSILRNDRLLAKLILKIRGDIPSNIFGLNKTDLYNGEQKRKYIEKAQISMNQNMIPFSAKTGEGISNLLLNAIITLPDCKKSDIEIRIQQFIQKLIEKQIDNKRRDDCKKIINETMFEASKIGASKNPSGAILLTLHNIMINKIANQFNFISQDISSYNFYSKIDFFINSILQALKTYLPKEITSSHAMIWTEKIGNYSVDLFSDMSVKDDNTINADVNKIVNIIEK